MSPCPPFQEQRSKRAVVLLGPPGSGKSTIGAALRSRCGFEWISVGEILRNVQKYTLDPGIVGMATASLAQGTLLPDRTIRDLVERRAQTVGEHDVAFDGFPRTIGGLDDFDELFGRPSRGYQVIGLFLKAEERTLRARVGSRRRDDDLNEVAASQRMTWYQESTRAMELEFRNRFDTTTIDANRPLDVVLQQVCSSFTA